MMCVNLVNQPQSGLPVTSTYSLDIHSCVLTELL